jgi:PAS domain S-box-containing protein
MNTHDLDPARKRLNDADQLYETIFAHAPIGIEIYDERGIFIDANRKCLDIFGVTDQALIRNFTLFEDPNVSTEHRAALKKGTPVRYEVVFDFDIVRSMNLYPTTKSGTIDLSVIIEPLSTMGQRRPTGYIVLVQDITDQVRTKQALLKTKQMYDGMASKIQAGIYLLRSKPNDEFTFEYVSPRMADMYGVSADRILADPRAAFEVIHPDEVDAFSALNLRSLRTRQAFDWEGRAVVEGSIKWLHIISSPEAVEVGDVLWHGLVTDVTEHKLAEESLKRSEEKFSKAFKVSPEAITIASMVDKRFIDVNEVFQKITGYSRAEVIDRTSLELNLWVSPEDRLRCYDTLRRDGYLKNFEVQYRMKSGEIRDFELSCEVIDLDGEPCNLNFIFDITDRKRAEVALRESEERYHNLLDVAPVGIAVQCEGKIVFTNPAGMKILGAESFDQLIGKSITEIIHPDGIAQAMHRIQRLIAGEKNLYPVDDVYVRLDGTPVDVEVVSTMLTYNGKPAAQVIVTDITGRKNTEEALRYERSLLRTLIDNIPDSIYTKDLSFRKTLANAAEVRNLGVRSEAEVLGKDDFELYPRELAAGFMADDQLVVQTGNPVINREEYILDSSGKIQWLLTSKLPLRNSDDEIIGLVGIGRDITDRKISERLLSEEKERLSITLRSIGDGVITTDTNSTIVMLNKAAEEMTGWKTEDAAGRHLTEVFVILNELTREQCENPVEKVLASGTIIELANHTSMISKDGRELVIADSAAPIRDTQSRIIGVVLVFRDMTEKQKLNDSIQRAQKLESLGILAGGIAHDFNNMLAGIFGYLDIARESAALKKTDQIPKYLDKALGVFDRAKGLTQQLLTFSKGGTPDRKTLELEPIIRHSASFALSGSNVICELEFEDNLSLCDCDETQIGQAIDNIVINAKQAMPMGGKIVITASNLTDAQAHPGNFVAISIRDEGIGMPKEILPKIFDPFFSTKQTGHGLGLATVFSIIQRHGGWIDVESKPGRGTTFRLFLPASQAKKISGSSRAPVEHRGAGTVLVMDDEEFIREIVGGMLENMGYDVVCAKDGPEAVTLFTEAERSGTPFAASILDMTIPGGIGGKEVAASLRAINPSSIIIASSGYSEDPVISNPIEHGFTDRIIKPYRKDELVDLMIRTMPE